MRSIKSELYLFIKTIIQGGTYTDEIRDVDYIFAGIPGIKFFGVWNSESASAETKDNYPTPAVFFEWSKVDKSMSQTRQRITDDYATSKDDVNFTLYVISGKYRSENREADYLDNIDLMALIFSQIQDKGFSGCKDLEKESESIDHNSNVLLFSSITFSATVTNVGQTSLVDANDILINPSAPFQFEIVPSYL